MNVVVQHLHRALLGLVDVDEARWCYVFNFGIVVRKRGIRSHGFFGFVSRVVAQDVREYMYFCGSSTVDELHVSLSLAEWFNYPNKGRRRSRCDLQVL